LGFSANILSAHFHLLIRSRFDWSVVIFDDDRRCWPRSVDESSVVLSIFCQIEPAEKARTITKRSADSDSNFTGILVHRISDRADAAIRLTQAARLYERTKPATKISSRAARKPLCHRLPLEKSITVSGGMMKAIEAPNEVWSL